MTKTRSNKRVRRWGIFPSAYSRKTAKHTLSRAQKFVLAAVMIWAGVTLTFEHMLFLKVVMALFMAFLLPFIAFRMGVITAAPLYKFPRPLPVADADLPKYTTLHPMFKEANMIPLVVAAMEAMNYPKHLMECILVLEERDHETVEAAKNYGLPDYFKIVETPAVKPYGKPKACNYALQFATGDYVVIFDAEDKPEPDQLRKAVGVFRAADEAGDPLGCVQARLVFENQEPLLNARGKVLRDAEGYRVRPTTWVSRFLGNEYTVHFEFVLAGLSKLNLPVPLGGTSNHFPLSVLKDLAFNKRQMPEGFPQGDNSIGAWDPWNVTEDAELGSALAASGYKTVLFDSYTNEEAVLTTRAALNQRSRWVKGYAQTSLALLKQPVRNMAAMGFWRFWAFQLQVGGAFLSLLLAPLSWGMTILYFTTRAQLIIELFPLPLFYTGIALLIIGNLGLLTLSLISAMHRQQYSTVRYLLTLTPIWWMVLSAATYVALLELIFPNWHPAWNKTAHGIEKFAVWWERPLIAIRKRKENRHAAAQSPQEVTQSQAA
ncbi:hypothetical protein BH09PAT4_BH09PAT4_00370 [soil metagenome]